MDISDYLYCSMGPPHQVIKKLLDSPANTSIIVAGNCTVGAASNMINSPRGIFVDGSLNLYVADSGNNRIQLFRPGQLEGMTVPINGSNGAFALNSPIDVTLDADGYLFIVDQYNHRILGSGSAGFRCIVGCSGVAGAAADQLSFPGMFSFDSRGDLIVVDLVNNRLQKFLLTSNECGEFYTCLFERNENSMEIISILQIRQRRQKMYLYQP